ncbi:hypothetical protein DL766_001940 [Monosporascus sp. MC13-8B]|uniref:DNA replication regulator SLD2 n=1 Tax=Monosporascus cannonballus TaxID=155416 RepID=A0ABY0HJ07_9PEZI|nr:hypothetical protein DL762_000468 [Monosporascus cannonballus]RYO96161.1 hypothetical protein DL763_003362 [Monosporascus cannonballus]RYP36564.1 hypothetical protein DL766_001940 [Monosporascus sp. MC13-8B]
MDENERRHYEATAQELRTELKRFEGNWAKQNDGRKPGREDIKQNPDIAKKYKQYNQVRDIIAGKLEPPKAKEPSRSRKRTTEEAVVQTPSKRHRSVKTPSKSRQYDVDDVSFETPSSRKLFSPAVPTSIGPTPQKDGRVLGLFDLLVENDENTPSRPRTGEASKEDANVQATPSRRAVADDVDELEAIKLGRTPMSTSKRTMLNTFMTPLKLGDGNSAGAKTPTSVSKLQFSTPSFLRRAPLPTIDENEGYKSPRPLRLPRKPLGRSLSSIVATLRKVEEETLDDDLEALHEMENNAPAPRSSKPAKPSSDDVLVQDSQAPQLLGGFDDEGLYDSPTEEALSRDGQPLRVYKKKGQKRTTRRVNMRPTRTTRPQQSVEEKGEDEEQDTVPETQFDASRPDNQEPPDLGSDSDFDGSKAGDGEDSRKKQPKKDGIKEPKEEGRLRKAARKVNAMAHANFKRLKLKNHGAKGGPGFNSRFRRHR